MAIVSTNGYLGEVTTEMRKVVWPTRQAATQASIIVLIAVVVMATLIFAMDYGASSFVLHLFD